MPDIQPGDLVQIPNESNLYQVTDLDSTCGSSCCKEWHLRLYYIMDQNVPLYYSITINEKNIRRLDSAMARILYG